MNEVAESPPRPSEVAMWHRLSGLPDNVTDAGDIVEVDAGRRLSAEKALLRAAINELSAAQMPRETKGLARLAASYLIAGDVETARRYVSRARDNLEEANHATD
jgi:hypothetical protein